MWAVGSEAGLRFRIIVIIICACQQAKPQLVGLLVLVLVDPFLLDLTATSAGMPLAIEPPPPLCHLRRVRARGPSVCGLRSPIALPAIAIPKTAAWRE